MSHNKSSKIAWAALLIALPLVAGAQEKAAKPRTVADVEAQAKKRAEAFLSGREALRLWCSDCGTGLCKCRGTHVNPKKLDSGLWRYFRPSFKKEKRCADWVAANVYDQAGEPAWGGDQLAWSYSEQEGSIVVSQVVAGRDTVRITTSRQKRPERRTCDAWVWEDGAFYIDTTADPAEELVQHPWFNNLNLSVTRLGSVIANIAAASAGEPNATDLQKAKKREERLAAEAALRDRVVADIGLVANVTEQRGGFAVAIDCGWTSVSVRTEPEAGEDAKALRQRLTALQAGSRVAFRGKPTAWEQPARESGIATLVVVGNVAAAAR
jgi:hypothetical protein